MTFLKHLRPALAIFVALTIICGVLYPLVVTLLAQVIFPEQANGSLILRNGKVVGSGLIGQPFPDPKYFWSRPSSTSPSPYNAASSYASNYGPLNPALLDRIKQGIQTLRASDSLNTETIPVDLVSSSGSGLDPHISVAAAMYQIPRVAHARGLSEEDIRVLVALYTEGRQFGILGEPRVNVLKLNLALNELRSTKEGK